MPKVKLTDRNVASIKPIEGKQVDYWDTVRDGLGLRISPGGRKTWMVRYRIGTIRKRLKLGTYPVYSLADAREESKDIIGDLYKGNDPALNRLKHKGQITVNEMARIYLEKHSKRKKRSWRKDKAMLDQDILPEIGHLRPSQVEYGHIEKIIEKVEARGALIQANRVFEVVRGLFNWGIGKYVKVSPCYGMKKPNKERPRDRNLRGREIKEIWEKIENASDPGEKRAAIMTEQSQIGLKLLLLLGQRVGEVAHAMKGEFDLDEAVWDIPAERTKNKRPHRVPLPSRAVDLVKRAMQIPSEWPRPCETDYIFPSPVQTQGADLGEKPIGTTSLNHALNRVLAYSEIKDVRPHDFREAVATGMASLGIPEVHIGAVLNHIRGNVTAMHCIRHSYDREKRVALEAWERKLEAIIEGRMEEGKVVPIGEASA